MPLTVSLIGAGIGAAGTLTNLSNSYEEREKARRQLSNLGQFEDAVPTNQLNQFYSTATNDARNARGFSGAERAAFRGDLANNTNTVFSNASRTSGGNLSRYISNALNANNVNALNRFAAQDAQLRTQNRNNALGRQYAAVGQYQDISNRNVAARNMRQQLIAQALGAGIAQQNQNIAGAYNNFANLGFTAAGYGLGSMLGTGGNQATSSTKTSPLKYGIGGYDYSTPDYTQPFYG